MEREWARRWWTCCGKQGWGGELAAVTISAGERESFTGGMFSVPKRDLIAGVQVLLEQGQMKIARGLRDAGALVRELVDVKMSISGAGNVRLGAGAVRGSTTIW